MKREFQHFPKIFSFTLIQHIKSKGYRNMTIALGILLLVLPAFLMILASAAGDSTEPAYVPGTIARVYVVDPETETDYALLNQMGDPDFSEIDYERMLSLEDAAQAARGSTDSLILLVEQGSPVKLQVLLPEETTLEKSDASYYTAFLDTAYGAILAEKSGLDQTQLAGLLIPVSTEVETTDAEGTEAQDPLEALREVIAMVLPYVVIMVLYFMILAYGQGVANSVLMEKTSKLVDTFLVTVRPGAMMMGKVLAIALSGVMQLLIWVACLAISLGVGTALVKAMDPGTDLAIIQLFDLFGTMDGLFSVGGIVAALLIFLTGFLMYCALAAIGGSLASKPEDLSSTNFLFTMALVISFFCVLYSSSIIGGDGYTWQIYVPFTAMLVVPSLALLGEISTLQFALSLGLTIVATVALIYFAGKIYRLMILRKGNPISPTKIFELLRGKETPEQ